MPTAKPPLIGESGGNADTSSESGPNASGMPRTGELIADKYQVERILGRGGMGVVLSARHVVLGHHVAIKVLHEADDQAAERFLREAKVLGRLTSDHIVRVYDFGRLATNSPYLVMEHLGGEDLAQLLARGPVPVHEAIRYVLEVCEALQEAHSAGIVHRDLKPANLFLATRTEGRARIKVLDFGLSKQLSPNLANGSLSLTTTVDIVGSPRYMSPEQAHASKEVDVRTDIWSLGVILYELVTGSTPFRASSFTDLIIRIATQPPEPIGDASPDVSRELESVILRCLAKERSERFQSVIALAEALKPLLDRVSPPGFLASLKPPAADPKPRSKRALWIAASVTVLAIATAVSWFSWVRVPPAPADQIAPNTHAKPADQVDSNATQPATPPAPSAPLPRPDPDPAAATPSPEPEVREPASPPERGKSSPTSPPRPRNKHQAPRDSLEIGEILPP